MFLGFPQTNRCSPSAGLSTSPACGERSDRIEDAIRVRGTLGELNFNCFRGDSPSPQPSPREERGEGEESQPQHRLGDDVALDLVGAAVDRDLAVVEVARRDLRGPVHCFVTAIVAVLVIGRGERADHLHQKLGRGLLDFRALDLSTEEAGLGLPLPCLPSSATTRSWVNSSAFSSISTAASFSRNAWSSITGLPPDSTLEASSLMRRMRSLETPTRAMPVRSLPSRNFA